MIRKFYYIHFYGKMLIVLKLNKLFVQRKIYNRNEWTFKLFKYNVIKKKKTMSKSYSLLCENLNRSIVVEKKKKKMT